MPLSLLVMVVKMARITGSFGTVGLPNGERRVTFALHAEQTVTMLWATSCHLYLVNEVCALKTAVSPHAALEIAVTSMVVRNAAAQMLVEPVRAVQRKT